MMMFMRFPEGMAKALTMSYDDGMRQDRRLVEIFNKNGIKATFNINSASFGQGRIGEHGEDRTRFTVEEALEVFANSGHEIALHSHTHPHLDKMPRDMVAYEIVKDREALENIFGRIVKGMAYPMGTTNDFVVETLKNCGVSYARTTVQTERFDIPSDWLRLPSTCHHNNPKLMDLANDFLNNNKRPVAKLFYVWGHSYEFDVSDNWNRIETFCEYVGKKDDVWYATNIEIYNYIEAYNRLKTSANGKIVHNPTSQTLWFLADKLYSVAPGETIKL